MPGFDVVNLGMSSRGKLFLQLARYDLIEVGHDVVHGNILPASIFDNLIPAFSRVMRQP